MSWGKEMMRRQDMHRDDGDRRARRGFTLLELLVSISIIGLLLSILSPAFRSTLASARGFKCKMSLRSLALDFAVYADSELHGKRGRDDDLYKGRFFTLSSFVDSQYGAAEFWRYDNVPEVHFPDTEGNDPLRDPEVHGDLVLRQSDRVFRNAIQTPKTVSYAFNMRLDRAEVTNRFGQISFHPVVLSSDVLTHGSAPLAWDIDAPDMWSTNRNPSESAPSLDSAGPYKNDRLWSPALRHNGAMNVAFIDGHVTSTKTPLKEHGYEWGYQGGN